MRTLRHGLWILLLGPMDDTDELLLESNRPHIREIIEYRLARIREVIENALRYGLNACEMTVL